MSSEACPDTLRLSSTSDADQSKTTASLSETSISSKWFQASTHAARILRAEQLVIFGGGVTLFAFCREHRPDGMFRGPNAAETIERIAGWDGIAAPGHAVAAMAELGVFDIGDGYVRVRGAAKRYGRATPSEKLDAAVTQASCTKLDSIANACVGTGHECANAATDTRNAISVIPITAVIADSPRPTTKNEQIEICPEWVPRKYDGKPIEDFPEDDRLRRVAEDYNRLVIPRAKDAQPAEVITRGLEKQAREILSHLNDNQLRIILEANAVDPYRAGRKKKRGRFFQLNFAKFLYDAWDAWNRPWKVFDDDVVVEVDTAKQLELPLEEAVARICALDPNTTHKHQEKAA